jgi:parvulin-like peptidyl-prolyl isomerase
MGLFKDSATVRFRRDTEEQTLARALYRRLAPSDISVSTAEVDSFYRWRGTESHLALIFVSNRAAADAAMNALRRGEPFDSVADRFSPSRMLPPGGDMGYLTSGSLVDPLDSFLHAAPVGKLLGPVEAPGQGWFIARILDRRPARNRPAPDVERPWLANAIQQRKQRAVSTRAFTDLAAEYHVRVEPGAAQDLFMIAIHQRAAADGSGDLTPEQRARVLVRYEDGNGRPLTFTVEDALANIEARPADRPNFMMMPAIETWLQSQAVQRAAVLEARRRHIGEEPAVAHEIEERVNNHVLEQVFTRIVQDATEPSEEELQAAYQRHAASYLELHGVRLLHATFPDSAAAAALMLHGGHSGTMREAAQMAGVESRVVEERVPFPNPREPWKSMQATFVSMGPREWSGPSRTPGGWMVVQLLEKQEDPQPFARLAPVIQQSLRDEALAFRRDRKLTRYTDSLRTVVKPFELSPERLNRIPWPVPPAAPGAGT